MPDLAAHLSSQFDYLAPGASALALALSGGADSWGLTLLARDYCQQHGLKFHALTVDHRLRDESAAEAAQVAAACAARDVPHTTLVWQHDGVDTRKQERARAARYQLLGDWCATNGFQFLLTAHHADDQAETVLLRFCRGSGVKGLAGMAAARPLTDRVTLLRPLLEIPKADLLAFAQAAGVPIATDPSNANPAYARPRLRAAREVLARERLTTATLLKTAAAARAETDALDYATQALLLSHGTITVDSATLPAATWDVTPPALQQRAFLSIHARMTDAQSYPPERDAVAALCLALTAGDTRRTLGGLLAARARNVLTFTRENTAERTIVS